MHHTKSQTLTETQNPRSDALLHLGDVELDMALHLHVLFASAVHFVLDLLFEIDHLMSEKVSINSFQDETKKSTISPSSPSARS